MRAYSMDLRARVPADCDAEVAAADVAAKYRVSVAWVRRVRQRKRDQGEAAPRAGGRGPKPSWDGYADRLRRAVADDPDATLEELKARLGLAAALSTLWRAVAALGLTLEESRPTRPSRPART